MGIKEKTQKFYEDAKSFVKRSPITAGIFAIGNQVTENYLPEMEPETNVVMGALGGLGIIAADKYGSKKISKWLDKNVAPKAKTLGLLGTLGLATAGLWDDGKAIVKDGKDLVSRLEEPSAPKYPRKAGAEHLEDIGVNDDYELPDFTENIKLADKTSRLGMVQRTRRWAPAINAVEEKYGIPKNYLAGIVMHESYGDPLQPNASNDGGLGLVHTQGPTAKDLGLKIYGDSHSSRDTRHGKKIKKMIEDCDSDLECVAEKDERAHPVKNLDAIARYMLRGYKKHGNWNDAITYVHGPGWVGKPHGDKYLKIVKSKINDYGNLTDRASQTFNNMNKKTTWEEYTNSFEELLEENFDLGKYK